MADKRETCSVFIEDPVQRTVILLRYGQGENQGLWTVPGGLIDEEKDPREQAEMIATEELGVEVELYPYHEKLEYPNRISHIFKGRLVDVIPTPGEIYDRIKNVSYDNILNMEMEGSIEADMKRLDGDFFQVYIE